MERIEIRLNSMDKSLFQQAAEIAGYTSLSSFVLSEIKAKSTQIVNDYEVLKLNKEDSLKLMSLLSNGYHENDALVSARKKYESAVAHDGIDH